jgi:hypothetical protein
MRTQHWRYFAYALLTGNIVCGLGHGSAFAADALAAPETPSRLHQAMFNNATLTFHVRSYLFDRDNTAGSDPAALAAGGWIGYETDWLSGFLKLGAVGYTSQPFWAPEDRDGTLLLMPGQEGFSVLGQAYAALKHEEHVLTLYRQIVNQPEVNPQDSRMVPNSFEGAVLDGKFGPLDYTAGILTAMKTRNDDAFVNIADAAGVNENSYMILGGIEIAPASWLKTRTALYVVPDLLASSYSDSVWTASAVEGTELRLSGQFMYQTGLGEELLTGPGFDAWVWGIRGDLIHHGLTLTAGYTGNGSNGNWQSPYGTWPGYTHMIVKDFNRAGEQALLLGATYDFKEMGAKGLVFTGLAAFDLDIDSDLSSNVEYDVTMDYRLSALEGDLEWIAPLWFRIRYAHVDTANPDHTHGRLDDFRVIMNYEFQLRGSGI